MKERIEVSFETWKKQLKKIMELQKKELNILLKELKKYDPSSPRYEWLTMQIEAVSNRLYYNALFLKQAEANKESKVYFIDENGTPSFITLCEEAKKEIYKLYREMLV